MKQRFRAAAFAFVILAALCFWQIATVTFAQQPAPQQTPVEVKIDPKIFDSYVGQYEDPADVGGAIFSFFREGKKFYLRVTNYDKLEIFPSTENKFFPKLFPAEAEFERDSGGRINTMIWRQNGRQVNMKRIADQPAKSTFVQFKRTEAMIPMRDGTRLFTVIFAPENQIEPLPILMERSPYGVKGWSANGVNVSRPELVKDGYVFVFQDIRGRYESEGEFVMVRPPADHRDKKAVDESTDTFDTIEYLLKNVPNNNGRVGIYGVSYGGWLSAIALIDPHPALKASSPQAPVGDVWMGDDLFHHGAFRQTYAHDWAYSLEAAKGDYAVKLEKADAFDYYFDLKTVGGLADRLKDKSATWRAFVEHPAWDSFWQQRSTPNYLKDTSVPTLIVGGFWDQEDLYGPLAIYKSLEKNDRDNQVFLVMGPWNHGGWGGRGRRLGAIDFGSDTGKHFRSEIQAPFFAFHLKGKGNLKLPEASIFQSGSNRWMNYDSWTPRNTNLQKRNLYLQPEGKLSFQKPGSGKSEDFQAYVSDPANPVPYRKRPILGTYAQGSTWFTWLVDDQRFLADRKDVLAWQSDVLTEDVTVTGDIIANLFASTSGTDSDWVVKLIDVYPSEYAADPKMAGYQLMVASEIFRGRYRKSFEKAEAIEPNKPVEYTIDLRGNDYTFKKGHRMMVQVQSTWFPLYDRNPQKFVDNIFRAKETDYQTATQRIYFSAKQPSHISVSVAGR
jgi:uncharacterized protein